nr:MAG TPA: hypothetical protein [Caudoviricetes sp.]
MNNGCNSNNTYDTIYYFKISVPRLKADAPNNINNGRFKT